jgi:hypothetical protein
MTQHAPDDTSSFFSSLGKELNVRTVVAVLVVCVSTYMAIETSITELKGSVANHEARINGLEKNSIRRDQYTSDQTHVSDDLKDIKEAQQRIIGLLISGGTRLP